MHRYCTYLIGRAKTHVKRKILKLLVKEILVGAESIIINHSIPLKETEKTEQKKSYQLCTRSDYPPLRRTGVGSPELVF